MQQYKIDVRPMTGQEKRDIQCAFFKLGYGWNYERKELKKDCRLHNFYYVNENGLLTHGEYFSTFESRPFKEIAYKELMILAYGGNIMNTQKQFTKSDLKDGMVVVYRETASRLVYNNLLLMLSGEVESELDYYNNNLTHKNTKQLDIMEVKYMGESLWKRAEQTEQQEQLAELKAAQEQLLLQAKEIADKIDALQRNTGG